jgi:hypothetical protein
MSVIYNQGLDMVNRQVLQLMHDWFGVGPDHVSDLVYLACHWTEMGGTFSEHGLCDYRMDYPPKNKTEGPCSPAITIMIGRQ